MTRLRWHVWDDASEMTRLRWRVWDDTSEMTRLRWHVWDDTSDFAVRGKGNRPEGGCSTHTQLQMHTLNKIEKFSFETQHLDVLKLFVAMYSIHYYYHIIFSAIHLSTHTYTYTQHSTRTPLHAHTHTHTHSTPHTHAHHSTHTCHLTTRIIPFTVTMSFAWLWLYFTLICTHFYAHIDAECLY